MHRRQLMTGAALLASTPAAAMDARAIVARFAATLGAHDVAACAALIAEGYVNHQISAAAAVAPGKMTKQATVELFAARLAGLPDLRVEMEATVADGDRAAASFVYSGIHTGPLLGVDPTGRRLRFTFCDIFAVRDSLIVEHWDMGDVAGILAQLRP